MAKKRKMPEKFPDPMCAECSAWKTCKGTKLEHHVETRNQYEADWDEEVVTCKFYKPTKQVRQEQEAENAWIDEEMAHFKSKPSEEES